MVGHHQGRAGRGHVLEAAHPHAEPLPVQRPVQRHQHGGVEFRIEAGLVGLGVPQHPAPDKVCRVGDPFPQVLSLPGSGLAPTSPPQRSRRPPWPPRRRGPGRQHLGRCAPGPAIRGGSAAAGHGPGACYFLFLRCTRVLRSSLRCFFLAIRLRRFLMTEPTRPPLLYILADGHAHAHTRRQRAAGHTSMSQVTPVAPAPVIPADHSARLAGPTAARIQPPAKTRAFSSLRRTHPSGTG